ncbi:histidine triad nucleotide-binding protein [Patescibacteria group bacterium]|nr:histidine triad nucleotide-binding protein [Patescibacteria group bacterium]
MSRPKKQPAKDCIFCQIATGKLPASKRFEDRDMVAFDDIHPHAPIHVLVIPKKHITSLADVTPKDKELMGKMLYRCKELARQLNIADSGYRVTVNVGKWGGQVVPHLHFHLLGGAPLTERLSLYTEAAVLLAKE